MLRIISSMRQLKLDSIPLAVNSINMESVRWRRKPRKPMWKGTAKSKLFRVPVRPVIPLEEKLELQRLFNKYRTEIKTIKNFLTLKYNEQNQKKDDQDLKDKEFELDFKACMKINDGWNAELKVSREARQAQELKDSIKVAEMRKADTVKVREQRLEDCENIVRREKDASKDFILPEMLDAAIENALSNPVDHNFALDLDGNKIIGRETTSTTKEQISGNVNN